MLLNFASSGNSRRRAAMLFCAAIVGLLSDSRTHTATAATPGEAGVVQSTTSGKLRPFGAYSSSHWGSTVTLVSDGSVLVYGYRMPPDGRITHAVNSQTLRHRQDKYFSSPPGSTPELWDPVARGWRKVPMAPECASTARYLHTATALPDKKVLIAGGLCDRADMADYHKPYAPYDALSLWDSASRKWLPAPALRQPRIYHSASLLPDGSVLIIGGENDPALSPEATEAVLNSVEQYTNGQVVGQSPLLAARAKHTATVLADGSVLVVGGIDHTGKAIADVEQWDGETHSWRGLPRLRVARYGHTATHLRDGRVMVAGGMDSNGRLVSSVEIWDPIHQLWSSGADLPVPLNGHAAALLASGRVMVAGGAWIASSWTPIPWAWTWNPESNQWQVAGHTMPSNETELSTGIALSPRPDGGALVFTGSYIMRWEPLQEPEQTASPLWQARPSAAPLSDGRVMLVGREVGGAGDGKPVARIWDPTNRTWTSTGAMNETMWMQESILELPSRRVIHVGTDTNRTFRCEIWNPAGNQWSACGSVPLQYSSNWRLRPGLLPDGRAFTVANTHEVLVFDETNGVWAPWRVEWSTKDLTYGAPIRSAQPLARIFDAAANRWFEINDAASRLWRESSAGLGPSWLWNPKAQLWAYVFPDKRMGRESQRLPDGCAISINPLAVFDPNTGKVSEQIDPGIGINPTESEVAVLNDGTVVIAGVASGAKDIGAGFFHRKASCAGFEPQAGDEEYIAGRMIPEQRASSTTTTRHPPEPLRADRPPWYEGILHFLTERSWLIAGGVVFALACLMLHRAGITRVQVGFPWVLRLFIYGLVVIFVAPAGYSYLKFRHVQAGFACEDDAKACLDPETGILKPHKNASGATNEEAFIPCRMIGVWSSRQGSQVRRIELKDDGTYFMEPSLLGTDYASGYTGYWAMQGQSMVWRHNQGNKELDVDKILSASDTSFTLLEGNGKHTEFELIRAVSSSRCRR